METATQEGFVARNRLAELGLTEEQLISAVQKGQAAWATCTPNHPQMFSGVLRWAETVRALRENLMPLGWKRSDEENLPFTINDDGTVAISVATGDDATGKPDESPCTKSRKGVRTKSAVFVNKQQGLLFGDIKLRPEHLQRINGRMTWLLLMYYDKDSGEIRAELSRPNNMGEDGYVDTWAERIILTPTPGDVGIREIANDNGPQEPDVVVEVKKKSA